MKDPDTATFGPEAAIWLPTETQWEYLNLDRWLNETDAALGALWTLTEATSISADWLVVGNGLYDPDGAGPLSANERGFVLYVGSLVPEPSVGLSSAMLLMGAMRRRRGR